jgi:Protein of unknown function (DUF2568)
VRAGGIRVLGATIGSTLVAIGLAVALPLIAAAAWGRRAAPRSPRRLAGWSRVAFEMSVFALAALALVLAGVPVPGGLLVVVAAIDAWALHRLGAGLRKRLAPFGRALATSPARTMSGGKDAPLVVVRARLSALSPSRSRRGALRPHSYRDRRCRRGPVRS